MPESEATDIVPEPIGWAIVELMGHRRVGGFVTEHELAGRGFLRVAIPGVNKETHVQFYAPTAVYCLTPATEATARAVAALARPEPVSRWELPRGEEVFGDDG